MPPYYPAGLEIRLEKHEGATSESTRVTANNGEEARRFLAEADHALSSGERLSEESVDCLAEQGDSALKFLGKNQTMPFYCMAVNRSLPVYGTPANITPDPATSSKDASEQHTTSRPKIKLRLRSTRSSAHAQSQDVPSPQQPESAQSSSEATYPIMDPPLGPTRASTPVSSIPVGQPLTSESLPLTLKIQLDPIKSLCRSHRTVYKDLKIEVFFNGELTHSTFVPARERNRSEVLNHVFSGRRIARIIEATWVLCPQQTQAKPRLSADNFYTHEARAEERWRQVASALQEEIAKMGIDERGKMPPSCLFLSDLANLRMPVAVRDMQGPTGQRFGTIDVVITMGQGRKEAPTGIPLREPQHLRISSHESVKPIAARSEFGASTARTSVKITDLESIPEQPVSELRRGLKDLKETGSERGNNETSSARQSHFSSRVQEVWRRIGRTPLRSHDVSRLKPTIAMSSSDFAVPTHILQQKQPWPSQPKLIVRLPMSSPSPLKAKSRRESSNFGRARAEDSEADQGFSPEMPKRRGSRGGRGGRPTSGRGQNWRLGMSRDPSSPNGWSSRRGSIAQGPAQTPPTYAAEEQAAAPAVFPDPVDRGSESKSKRQKICRTATAAITRPSSLPPARVFPTMAPSGTPSVPSPVHSSRSTHGRKDSASMSLATHSRTSSPDELSMAPMNASTSAIMTGPTTPAAVAYTAPLPSLLPKLNTSTSSRSEFKTPTIPASRTQSRAPTPASTRPSTPASTRPPTPSAVIPEVDVPATSRDCVITYKPGMVRQIKSERGGWFTEEEVLVGVRFIVCA